MPNDLPPEIQRSRLSQRNVATTANLDRQLPAALENIYSVIGRDWHKRFNPSSARLDKRFYHEPLCLIGSSRFDPNFPITNCFGLSLIMAEDYLSRRGDYHFLDGSMAVSQVAILGSKLKSVLMVQGNVGHKIQALLQQPGTDPNNTLFELLTAAAFQEASFDPRFVAENPPAKSPDLYFSVGSTDCYVECKRKAKFSEYEMREASAIRELFTHLRGTVLAQKKAGVIDLKLFWALDETPMSAIYSACLEAIRRKGAVYYPWGACSFRALPIELEISATRLYSPGFISEVAGYAMDDSEHDGVILQVAAEPDELHVEKARSPFAMTWRSFSAKAQTIKARAITSLFGKAVSQFPKGAVGFPYICYTENNGGRLADLRTTNLMDELHECYHQSSIVVPETLVTRLYAVPDAHGNPDLIENAMQFRSAHFSRDLYLGLPSLIFTHQRRDLD